MLIQTINSLWMWQSRGESRAFHKATTNIRQQQEELLQSTLRDNANSSCGREHRFATIKSLEDFQKHVPICDYESLRPKIEEIASGVQGVLTSEPVLMLEPTGGSSGGSRLIPYTATLRRQFQRAIAAWMYDVLSGFPGCCKGRAYWSISPAAQRPEQTPGGIRIGFDSDAEYLAGWQRGAMKRLLAVPTPVAQLRNIENFQYATLAGLLSAKDLALISVWSPTFLTTLFARLPNWVEQIVEDIEAGQLHFPQTDADKGFKEFSVECNRSRSRFLKNKLQEFGPSAEFLKTIWPLLSLVSAWGDASASMFLPELKSWLPDVPFQPKGLLATEGVTSFPLKSSPGSALAIRSHVFEFRPVETAADVTRPAKWAWELEQGRRYQVLLTTGGGLYRYAIGDEIEVTGFARQCPLLKFTGRTGVQSDLVGEKLHEQHVRDAIRRSCESLRLEPAFAMLIPVHAEASDQHLAPGYRAILVMRNLNCTTAELDNLEQQVAEKIEQQLSDNSQYRYAIGLGQLRNLDAWILPTSAERAWSVYESECRRRGQKSGDIKPTVIARGAGWDNVFKQVRRNDSSQAEYR
ncbi:MAG: GH3 auxin-responsive promoter family protein [Planctomycetales bacterium]|nr:GH3 auxin-responsive promoter family protein [Planctomycetales bacterium]